MRDLLMRPRRFSELEDSLGGMSPRRLAKAPKQLERERVIGRRDFTMPARFHDELTKKGIAFQEVVDAMRAYGKKHL